MSTQDPAAGAAPRVHHPHSHVTEGAGAQPAQLGPEVFRISVIADHLSPHFPPGIVYKNGQFEAAGVPLVQPQPQPVLTQEQAARMIAEKIYLGLTSAPQTFWPSLEEAVQFKHLGDGINPRAVREAFPFNTRQVLAGGVALIQTVLGDDKARTLMAVDVDKLGQDVALAIRASQSREALERPYQVVVANETVVLSRIAVTVDKALKVGESVIKADGQLQWVLRDALAIRGGPAAEAVANRAQSARDEQAIRADEQQKLQAAGSAAAPAPAQTTTVTTQAGPAAAGPAAAPKHPIHPVPKK